MRWRRHLTLLLLAGTGSALLLAFPWLMPNLPVLGTGSHCSFLELCHQDPARSFVLAGTTLPVCARCLAFYSGGFAGIACYPVLGFRWRQGFHIKRLLVVLCASSASMLASIWPGSGIIHSSLARSLELFLEEFAACSCLLRCNSQAGFSSSSECWTSPHTTFTHRNNLACLSRI